MSPLTEDSADASLEAMMTGRIRALETQLMETKRALREAHTKEVISPRPRSSRLSWAHVWCRWRPRS